MTDKVALKILKMEKDKLILEPEATRDWELITALEIGIEAVKEIDNYGNCVLTMFGNCSYNKTGCSDCEIKDKIHKALKERPQGEWIHYLGCGVGTAVCSVCGQLGETKKYCGNCGRRMRGGYS